MHIYNCKYFETRKVKYPKADTQKTVPKADILK